MSHSKLPPDPLERGLKASGDGERRSVKQDMTVESRRFMIESVELWSEVMVAR